MAATALLLLAMAANWIAKKIVLRLIRRALSLSPLVQGQDKQQGLF